MSSTFSDWHRSHHQAIGPVSDRVIPTFEYRSLRGSYLWNGSWRLCGSELGERQPHGELGVTWPAGDGDGAVMSVDDSGHNSQSQTGAAAGRRIRCAHPACVASGKPLEDAT